MDSFNGLGQCEICSKNPKEQKHHSKPGFGKIKREGPIWYLCAACHKDIHRKFSNEKLRNMSFVDLMTALGYKGPFRTRKEKKTGEKSGKSSFKRTKEYKDQIFVWNFKRKMDRIQKRIDQLLYRASADREIVIGYAFKEILPGAIGYIAQNGKTVYYGSELYRNVRSYELYSEA